MDVRCEVRGIYYGPNNQDRVIVENASGYKSVSISVYDPSDESWHKVQVDGFELIKAINNAMND